MSTFGNPILLKSQYISIFVFIVPHTCPESLMYQCFYGFPKGAHLFTSLNPVFTPYLAKVLISLSLGDIGRQKPENPESLEIPNILENPENLTSLNTLTNHNRSKTT